MIKKITLLPLFLFVSLHSSELEKVYSYYKNKKFKEACYLGLKIFNKHKKSSEFLMLYGFSCLNADYIDRLAIPLTGLRDNKTERANASYFATILLQKKLLYHSLIDNVDITHLRLPVTDYVLSKVFDLYTRGKYKKVDEKYYLTSKEDPKILYVLYIDHSDKIKKMILEERLDNHIIKTHRYW